MGLAEQMEAAYQQAEIDAEAADARDERIATELREAWDECLKQRSIDAPIGGGYFGDLIEVLNDVCSDSDQTINRALMQALVHCAAKGQIEAVEALGKVKDYFVEQTLEFKRMCA